MNIQVLSSNTLVELRDAFKCPKDAEIPGDFSSDPTNSEICSRARNIFLSSMIFIEDKFFVDTRHSKCLDYSR